jgi:hypothetical protein
LLPDALNTNHELLKEGWCWWYRKYAAGKVELERLETEAREAKKRKAKRDARVHLAYTSTFYLRVKSSGWDFSDDLPMKWRGFSPVRFSGCTM